MNGLALTQTDNSDLPTLVDRAASMLAGAKTAAEVLEAREFAGLAYDAAKRAARLSRAKAAHDDLIAAAHRAQADALRSKRLPSGVLPMNMTRLRNRVMWGNRARGLTSFAMRTRLSQALPISD